MLPRRISRRRRSKRRKGSEGGKEEEEQQQGALPLLPSSLLPKRKAPNDNSAAR
jgi:hypothetical protein